MFNKLYEMTEREAKQTEKEVKAMMIRTINKAYEELKARDPETAISKSLVRSMISSGVVPHIQTGNRRLVDVDVLEEYVNRIVKGEEN